MMSHDGPSDADAWTAMPLDLDAEVDPLAIPRPRSTGWAAALHKKALAGFDLNGLFWKYFASGDIASPSQVLNCLATDERVQIRRRVADNVNAPTEALALLSEDSDPAVRAAVARNPQTPIFILKKLSQDPAKEVRFAIASNPEMPDAILLSLFLDPDPFVAERASETLAA